MKKALKIHTLDNKGDRHRHVIPLFALLGLLITAVMGVIRLYHQDYMLASALFLVNLIYFVGYYTYNKYNNIKLSSAIILYSMYGLMFYLVYTGGVENTGPLWIYIVAPVSVFLHGLRRGLIEIIVFVIIIAAIMFIPANTLTYSLYGTEFKLRLIYSFLTVTFLSALYEYTRERSYNDTLELSKKYQQLAYLDPLTQLSNRRDALSILKHDQSRILRSKEALSIILCDVDYFKKVNDQYGHSAGDAVLIELAEIFTSSVREQDCVARWGGEEFLFILPQTNAENAYILAEKIKARLQNHLITFEGEQIKVTVSMGIVQLNETLSIDEAINNADKYLYQAKNAGRNQIFPTF